MKKIVYVTLFLFAFFYARAAKVDTLQVYSAAMNKNISSCVITPDSYDESSKNFPVVYLLNGYSGNYATWVKSFKEVAKQVDKYGFIVIGVDGGYSSWYFDSPIDPAFKYETYIMDELVPFIDKNYKTIASRDSRAISGLSMGGHGALYLALKHQDLYGAAGSMSGGVDIRPFSENWDIKKRIGSITDFPENWEKNTVINMLDLAKSNKLKLIIDCGVDDFFIDVNRNLHDKMLSLKIDHDYIERPGKHNIEYWENSLKFQLLFFHNFFNETVRE
jgi:S-formylglutathione hydrolase FrmB